MNIELLQRVKHAILSEPSAFRMDVWSCGTAHCIGGHACLLSGLTPVVQDDFGFCTNVSNGTRVMTAAAGVLRLSTQPDIDDDYYGGLSQSDRLFMVEHWPADLEERYDAAKEQSTERAVIAAERIERFITSGGAE